MPTKKTTRAMLIGAVLALVAIVVVLALDPCTVLTSNPVEPRPEPPPVTDGTSGEPSADSGTGGAP